MLSPSALSSSCIRGAPITPHCLHASPGYVRAADYCPASGRWAYNRPRRNTHEEKPSDSDPSGEQGNRCDNVKSPDTSGRPLGKERCRFAQKIAFLLNPRQFTLQPSHFLIPGITGALKGPAGNRFCLLLPAGQRIRSNPNSRAT